MNTNIIIINHTDGILTITEDAGAFTLALHDGIGGWDETFSDMPTALMRAATFFALQPGDSFTHGTDDFAHNARNFVSKESSTHGTS